MRMKFGGLVPIALGLILALPATASAHTWTVDDACSNADRGTTYFFLGGPLTYWKVHNGLGVNNCHMWTTTIDETISDPVNYAAYYLPTNTSYDHVYDFFAWFHGDCDSHFRTRDARYRRYRDGTNGGVTEVYRVNQNTGSNCTQAKDLTGSSDKDQWNGSLGGYTMLIDKSTDPPGTRLGADQVQWVN